MPVAVKTEPFDIGDDVTIAVDFTDDAGDLATPADYDLIIQKPDGTEVTYLKAALANPTVGRVEKVYTIDQSGLWYFRYRSLASPKVVKEGFFRVRETQFPA